MGRRKVTDEKILHAEREAQLIIIVAEVRKTKTNTAVHLTIAFAYPNRFYLQCFIPRDNNSCSCCHYCFVIAQYENNSY